MCVIYRWKWDRWWDRPEGMPPCSLILRMASRRCFGCSGPESPCSSITSKPVSTSSRLLKGKELLYKYTFFNHFADKNLGYSCHCYNDVLWHGAACYRLHQSLNCGFRKCGTTVHFVSVQLFFGEIRYQNPEQKSKKLFFGNIDTFANILIFLWVGNNWAQNCSHLDFYYWKITW